MTDRQPITPPPELAQTLWNEMRKAHHEDIPCSESWNRAIAKAYQAGADMELDACYYWIENYHGTDAADSLQQGRRPKPPIKADQALAVLNTAPKAGTPTVILDIDQFDTILLALKRMKELEGLAND